MEWLYWTGGGITLIALMLFVLNIIVRSMRHAVLLAKYGSDTVVEKLLAHTIWQGMSREQLVDALGQPHVKEARTVRGKAIEVYKYGPLPRNSFRWRITLSSGKVTGWEEKAG